MKQNPNSESVFNEFQSYLRQVEPAPNQGSKAISGTSYARDLRVLGQIIDGYSFTSVIVELTDGHYCIRGLQKRYKPESILFTHQDITAAGRLYRQHRQTAGDAPDAFRFSQILRAVGFYLDTQRQATLKRLFIANNCISLEYQTTSGQTEILEKSLDFFYDYWVHMYLRRRHRRKSRLLKEVSVPA